jgi:type I restriction enzyme S subunit
VSLSEFEDVIRDASGGNVKVQKGDYLSSGRYPIIDQGQDFIGGYTDDASHLVKGKGPWIVFGDHTRALKFVDFPFCMGADGVKVLQLLHPSKADLKYVCHFLLFADIPSAGYSRHYKFLKRLQIPLPPLYEQKRIAAILDKADQLRQQRRHAIALLDSLTQSIFLEMFGDPVSNPKGWPQSEIREICKVVTGNTPPREIAAYYDGADIEWIKSDNIVAGEIFLSRAVEFLSSRGKAIARVAPPDSTLITCIAGSPNSIGNVGLADREVAFNQQINAVIPMKLEPWFQFFHLKHAKKLVQAQSTGGMKGLVSKSRLESVLLMKPPMELQQSFARRARFHSSIADRLTTNKNIEALFSSLQHRAFSAQL